MAPEQAAGARVDGRADVYALGVLLFEMITGVHPFPSTNDNEYVLRHADEAPPRPSKLHPVPRELDAIVLRCLAKRPEQRFPSAAAVAEALRRVNLERKRSRAGVVVALGGLAAAGIAAALIVPGLLADHSKAEAAAGAPAPASAPVIPAAPATIKLAFTSEPSGAKVFRKGETVPLGTTPFTTELVKSERATLVTFQLDGYEPYEVDASGSETIVAKLEKKAPPVVIEQKREARPTPKIEKKKPQVSREGVMDPFAPKN